MTRRIVLEVGVTGADEAARAEAAGADRLELCSGLELGGLTPSPGTFLAVREAVTIPVYVLLRPRVGGFTYSDGHFETMRRDADWFLRHGAAGVVVGVLQAVGGTNRIDHPRCRQLARMAGGKAVFHRAFDFVSDPPAALDELIDLGFERVQTSGGRQTAEAGGGPIADWVARAGGRIEIMPAGGVTPAAVGRLLRATRANQVHGSFRSPEPDPSLLANPAVAPGMGIPDARAGRATTSADLVRAMRAALDEFAARPGSDTGGG